MVYTFEEHQAKHPLATPALSKADMQHQEVVGRLDTLNKSVRQLVEGRAPFNATVAISATVPIDLDYRDRKHIFIFSVNSLTLSLEDLGTLALSANTWTNISFQPGLRIFAQSQATTVYVAIKQTDETIP